MADTGDERVDELLALYEDAEDDLSSQMAELATADDKSKEAIWLAIVALLSLLRAKTRKWLDETIAQVYAETLAAISEDLGIQVPETLSKTQEHGISELARNFTVDLDKAISSIRTMAGRFRRGQGIAEIAGLSTTLAVSLLRDRLRKNLKNGMVRLVGSDSKTYAFGLEDYVSLLTNRLYHETVSEAVVSGVEESGQDLVQVSFNPSTIGDYCDHYRGKVFSISGQHPEFPPIWNLPNGSCPLHPRCHHVLIPYTGGEHTGFLDADFVALGTEAQPWQYQRVWKQKRNG